MPAVSFILLSVFRWVLNAPRPYEIFGADPVIKKDTKGKSFPSRHVFSMFVIAVTVLYFCPVPGIVLVAAGVLMAAARVAGGVHFPADVIAGAVAGAAADLSDSGSSLSYFDLSMSFCGLKNIKRSAHTHMSIG